MKITLANGSIIEGTFAELNAAGLITEVHQVSTNTATKTVTKRPAYREGTMAARIDATIAKATRTGQAQLLAITQKTEQSARSTVHMVAKEQGVKASARKVRNGHRWSLSITA